MRLEVIDDVRRFDELRDEWNGAAERSVDANVFLTWEWLRTWWRHFGEPLPQHRLHLVVLRDSSCVVAAAPWFELTDRVGPMRATRLQQIGYNAGDYGGIVLCSDDRAVVDELISHVAGEMRRGTKTVVLSRLASDSVFLRLLRLGLARRRGLSSAETVVEGSVCPFADVRGGGLRPAEAAAEEPGPAAAASSRRAARGRVRVPLRAQPGTRYQGVGGASPAPLGEPGGEVQGIARGRCR